MNGCVCCPRVWCRARISGPERFRFACRLSSENAGAGVEIRLENMAPQSHPVNLSDLNTTDSAEFDGRRFVRKSLPLPDHASLGYHHLAITVGDRRASMRWIVTPDRAWLPEGLRAAGVAIPLYAVRSRRNWGCGDLRDLETVVDWVADVVQASFVALNPLHAIHNRRPYNISPYLPNSVFYHNFLYLDIESIPDFATSPRARCLWAKYETQQELRELRENGVRRVRTHTYAQAAFSQIAVSDLSSRMAERIAARQ